LFPFKAVFQLLIDTSFLERGVWSIDHGKKKAGCGLRESQEKPSMALSFRLLWASADIAAGM